MKALLTLAAILFTNSVFAAAVPDATLAPEELSPLFGVGESVKVNFTMDNTGATTGYIPIYRMIVPQELTYSFVDDCGTLGTPSITQNTTGRDPFTNELISLLPGEKLFVIEPPIAQLSPSQPRLDCNIIFTQTAFAAVGTSFRIREAQTIFVLGDDPSGDAVACGSPGDTICSPALFSDITPQLIQLHKHIPDPKVSGKTTAFTTTIDVDLASGSTINNVEIVETFSTFVQVDPLLGPTSCLNLTIAPAPTSCVLTPDPSGLTGGSVSLTYLTLSSDVSISYPSYVREFKGNGDPVIPVGGGSTTDTRSVTLIADEVTPLISESATVRARSHFLEKSYDNVSDSAPAGNSPNDILEYTSTLYVSDYFQVAPTEFHMEISDGQDLVPGEFHLTVREGVTVQSATEATMTIPFPYLNIGVRNGVTGITDVSLNAQDLMGAISGDFTDDKVSGAELIGAATTSTLTLKHRVQLGAVYTSVGAQIDASDLVSSKILPNSNVFVTGASLASSVNAEAVADIVKIPQLDVNISHINGGAPGVEPYAIQAGDLVTFKMAFTIPAGGTESLKITNYLPGPMLAPSAGGACLTGSAGSPPANDEWDFGVNDSGLNYGDVTVTCDVGNGTVEFDFGDITLSGVNERTEIYFTVTASNKPMSDGLKIIDSAYLSYQNSFGTDIALRDVAELIDIEAPDVEVSLKASSTSDPDASVDGSGSVTGIDAQEDIEYEVELVNTGRVTAQNTSVRITWPTELINPALLSSCSEAACDYDIDFTDVDCLGTPVITGTDETGISVSGISIADSSMFPTNTCTVSFKLRTSDTIQISQSLLVNANITWNVGGPNFPSKSTTASVQSENSSIAVSFDATEDATPSPGRPGQTTDWLVTYNFPEGVVKNASFQLREHTSNGAWVTFPEAVSTIDIGTLHTQTVNTVDYHCLYPTAGTLQNNICFTKDPTLVINQDDNGTRIYSVQFGDMVNLYGGNAVESFQFVIRNGETIAAAPKGNQQLRASITRTNPDTLSSVTGPYSSYATYQIVRPQLSSEACKVTPATDFGLGESIQYKALVKNTGTFSAKAFDVSSLSMIFPTGVEFQAGSLLVYSCPSVPATCAAATTAGCTDVTGSVVASGTSTMDVTVADGAGQPDIGAEQSLLVFATVDLNCSSAADSSGNDTAGAAHPDNDGVVDGCADPVLAFANSFNTRVEAMDYHVANGASFHYTSTVSNTVTVNLDHDNDGILNSVEGSGDSDGDGVADYLDTDADDNGIGDSTEGSGLADNDDDGTPDFQDSDDDDDGVADSREIQNGSDSTDSDGDSIMDFRDADSDNDGIADGSEDYLTTGTNSDGAADGPNYIDLDSDNDGIPDFVENDLGSCDIGGGTAIAGNGILEADEIAVCHRPMCVSDPCDSDENGAIELHELTSGALPDADGDGIPNSMDLDSDNDGIPDVYEAYSRVGLTYIALDSSIGPNMTVEGETVPGYSASTELTLLAAIVGDNDNVLESSELGDFDGDGIPNYLDTDSDNDGISDLIESNRYTFDDSGTSGTGNDNGAIDYATETSGDLIISRMDLSFPDIDSDGMPDVLDVDSDGDGIADWIEAFIEISLATLTNYDLDSSGTLSAAEAAAAIADIGDNNGILDYTSELLDSDLDGIPDFRDLDSNADTIYDSIASDSDANPATIITLMSVATADMDSDGKPNYLDDDTDGDSLPNTTEAGDLLLVTAPVDTDSDGTPDFMDGDSDDDGLDDEDEVTFGSSSILSDTDNDGCYDGCEVSGADGINLATSAPKACPYPTTIWWNTPANPIPVTSPTDADTDGGGVGDCKEAAPPPGRPVLDPRVGGAADDSWYDDDPDNDGLTNDEEVDLGTDYNNPDSDNDGLKDGPEIAIHHTDPLVDDTDGDGLKDGAEVNTYRTDPLDVDTDNDSLQDRVELVTTNTNPLDKDSDDDGLEDGEEVNTYGTNPNNPDTDGGGIPDGEEVDLGFNPLDNRDDDLDDDGLPNLGEIAIGLDPSLDDSNNDCLGDAVEVGDINNPRDTDGDGVIDALDKDNDGDGITDCEEIRMGTNPNDASGTLIQGSGGKINCGVISADSSRNANGLTFFILLLPILFAGLSLLSKTSLVTLVRLFVLLMVVGSFSTSTKAINIQHFWPVAGESSLITNAASHGDGAHRCNVNLVHNFLRNGLEFGNSKSSEHLDDIVRNLHSTNLGMHCEFSRSFSLYAMGSYHIATVFEGISSEYSTSYNEIGDTMVGGYWKIKEWRDEDSALSLSINPEVLFATGIDKNLVGNDKAIANFNLAVNYLWNERNEFNFSLGYQHREKEKLLNLEARPSAIAKAGFGRKIWDAQDVYLNAELFYLHPLSSSKVRYDVTNPFEVYGGFKKKFGVDKQWSLMAGGGIGLTDGYGSGDWRAYTGLNYSFILKPPMELKNGDIEIAIYGDINSFTDLKYSLKSASLGLVGSGNLDIDLNKQDLTPGPYHFEVFEGDEILSNTTFEVKVGQVVKKAFRVSKENVEAIKIEVDPIFFVTASSKIKEISYPTLDKLAAEINSDSSSKVSIHGHTDSDGSDQYNEKLSASRAQSVLDYLVAKGVVKNRLDSKGFGESKPIASNDTDEGKAKNRRVEFLKSQDRVVDSKVKFAPELIDGKTEVYRKIR